MLQARQWWTNTAGQVVGPNTEGFLALALRTGILSPRTLACEQGHGEWRALQDWPQFTSSCPTPSSAVAPKAPWDPRWILGLGLLYTPLWAGILTALNAPRLGLQTPRWRPLVVGVTGFVMWGFLPFDSWFVEILAYTGSLAALWFWDLRLQTAAWAQRQTTSFTAGSWARPLFFGSPLIVVAVMGFLVAPLLPATAQEVCEKFAQATTPETAQPFATKNLWPALSRMKTEPGQGNASLEILGQERATAELGGILIAGRFYWPGKEEPSLLEGIFHVVPLEGAWKIEEIYITAFNHTPADPPVRLSQSYRNLTADAAVAVEPMPPGEPVEMLEGVGSFPAQTARPAASPPSPPAVRSDDDERKRLGWWAFLGRRTWNVLTDVNWKRLSLLFWGILISIIGCILRVLSGASSVAPSPEAQRAPDQKLPAPEGAGEPPSSA